MKKKLFDIDRTSRFSGFTLIEIIITLIVLGYTGAMLFEVLNSSPAKSWAPLEWVREETQIGSVLELATSEYMSEVNSDSVGGDSVGEFTNFVSNLSSTIRAVTPPENGTITTSEVCFNSSGTLSSGCATEQVPLVWVEVTDENGRRYHTLFAKTRNCSTGSGYCDPPGEH